MISSRPTIDTNLNEATLKGMMNASEEICVGADNLEAAPPQFLSDAKPGTMTRVEGIMIGGEDAIRLKRLGICVGKQIEVVQTGDPLIIRVVGSHVGVSRILAAGILVRTPDVAVG